MQMMYKRFFVVLAVMSVALVSGCTKSSDEPDKFNIDSTDVVLTDSSAGTTDVLLSTNRDPEAVVETPADEWLAAEITRRCLTLKYRENETSETREGKVQITAGSVLMSVVVTQPGKTPSAPDPDPGTDPGPGTDPNPGTDPDPGADPDPGVETKFPVYKENGKNVGIIYWTSEDGLTSKVLSLARTGQIAWSTDGSHILNATDMDDGMANTIIMKSSEEAGSIPAVAFCDKIGDGWYWPSLNEMVEIFNIYNGISYTDPAFKSAFPNALTDEEKKARAAFDASLTAFGGTVMNESPLSEKGDRYWTSTELVFEGRVYGSFMTFGKAYMSVPKDTPGKTKYEGRYARCIKVIANN